MNGGSNAAFDRWLRAGLAWLPEVGIGYYPVQVEAAAHGYFEHYAGLAATDTGERINAARVAMVRRHWPGQWKIVDVGIGCGQFVESWPGVMGYDINPAGVRWLTERGLFIDPYTTPVDVACFWDVLEHIHNPAPLLANVSKLVFVALPIFRNLTHVLTSKHYKTDEHCWYFTEAGFRRFMRAHGWDCVERNDSETQLGREDILSFAFARNGTK